MRSGIAALTVIVPHFGDPSPTQTLIAQLLLQVEAPELDIIIVDDASPQPMPPVDGARLVRRARNGGFGSAVNTGAREAKHPHLLVLNSDLEVDPHFVSRLCEAALPWQPAVAGAALLDPDGTAQWSGRRFPSITQQVVEWLSPLARFRDRSWMQHAIGHDTHAVPGIVTPVDWVVGAAMLIPTDAFRAVGGFDERFHMNCEEVDLQFRLRRLGVPSIFVGTVSARHAGGGSSDPAARRRWLVASRIRYARKWGRKSGILRLSLSMASFVNLGANALRRAAGRPVRPLQIVRYELALLRDRGARG